MSKKKRAGEWDPPQAAGIFHASTLFLHAHCFIQGFLAEELHGTFRHFAAFVGCTVYDFQLPAERDTQCGSSGLTEVEVIIAPFHAVLPLGIGFSEMGSPLIP